MTKKMSKAAQRRLHDRPPSSSLAASKGYLKRGTRFYYDYFLFLQWSHSLLLLLSPAPVAFFSRGCETQWKTHDHPSCLPLLALTEIIYTPAYWKYGERGWDRDRGRGEGGGDSVHSCRFAQTFLVTGGWQEMMDLDEDTSLSVRTRLLHFIQLFSQWQTELGSNSEQIK